MKRLAILLALAVTLSLGSAAQAAMRVDIYGPGQNIVNLALAAPLTGPQKQASGMGAKLQKLVEENLSFLPFMRLTPASSVLGGTLLPGYEPPSLDFKRFQLAGSDIVVTTYWPHGDSGTSSVQIRAFETNTGGRLFGKEYPQVRTGDLPEVADRFCADLLEVLTGSGAFFRSTLAFVKKSGRLSANVWLVKPTGRDLRQITNIKGEAMSPAWSPDGRFIVFTHIDEKSHSLGVWDRKKGSVQRVRFPGNVVIGPSFTPDNKVENVKFIGGCSGNLQGISRLVQGKDVDEVISLLKGIKCRSNTSCPDQLSKALEEYKERVAKSAEPVKDAAE